VLLGGGGVGRGAFAPFRRGGPIGGLHSLEGLRLLPGGGLG
jgi:hypothetical protein